MSLQVSTLKKSEEGLQTVIGPWVEDGGLDYAAVQFGSRGASIKIKQHQLLLYVCICIYVYIHAYSQQYSEQIDKKRIHVYTYIHR